MRQTTLIEVEPDHIEVRDSDIQWDTLEQEIFRTTDRDRMWKKGSPEPVYKIGIHAIIGSDDDGGNLHPVTPDQIEILAAELDVLFEPAGIQFAFDKTRDVEVLRDTLLNQSGTYDPAELANPPDKEPSLDKEPHRLECYRVGMLHPGKLVLLFIFGTNFEYDAKKKRWYNAGFPGGSSSGGSYTVTLSRRNVGAGFAAHEIGHFLHVGHTFPSGAPESVSEAAEMIREAVEKGRFTREEGLLVFDADRLRVSDTPPDAGPKLFKTVYGSACATTDTVEIPVTFSNGDKKTYFLKPDRGNFMGYYNGCTDIPHHFSAEQMERMRISIAHGNRQRLIAENPQVWEAPAVGCISRKAGQIDLLLPAGDACTYYKEWSGESDYPDRWAFLGGYRTDSMAVTSWAEGRLDIVARHIDGTVLHKGRENEEWFPSSLEWHRLGGQIVHSPAAVSWRPGRLDIVVHGKDDQVWHKCWDDHRGGWSPVGENWRSLGGKIVDSPAVVSWGPGRLDIVVHGRDGRVWHKSWDETRGTWSPQEGWATLGGQMIGSPAAVSWGPGRLDIIVHGRDGRVWHKSWDETRGDWSPKGDDWRALGGNILGSPSVASWGPGRLDIVAHGSDHRVWHKSWDEAKGSWSPTGGGWRALGGEIVGSPKIVSLGPGKLYIFARDRMGQLLRKRWDESTSEWYPSKTEWAYDRNAQGF